MTGNVLKPKTVIEPGITSGGRAVDDCSLVSGDKKLPLTPSGFAFAQGGLLSDGHNLEEASEERAALRKRRPAADIISNNAGRTELCRLRKKIEDTFSGELVVSKAKKFGAGRIRILTKAELEEIHEDINNPKEGAYVICDEFGQQHLFFNKQEISPWKGHAGISPERLALFAMLLLGAPNQLNPHSESFRAAWRNLTGKDGISKGSFKVYLSNLRRALKVAGFTITRAPKGRGVKSFAHQLVPLAPEPTIMAKEAAMAAL